MDTADKRASAIYVGSPWRGKLPLPDAALDQGDRQQVAWMYRGVLAGEAEGGIACDLAGTVRILPRLGGTVDLYRSLGGVVRMNTKQEGTVDL